MPGNSRNQAYVDHVRRLEQRVECKDEAMRLAVGANSMQSVNWSITCCARSDYAAGILSHRCRLRQRTIGRQLASDTSIRYVGTDVVPRLLEAARTAAGRNDWEFRLLKVSGSRVRTMWPISSRSSLFSPTSPTRRVFNISRRIKWENRTVMKSLGNLGQSVAVLRKV